MKINKIFSFLAACMLLYGCVGVMESQTNTAYAEPVAKLGLNEWQVWGNDLHNEIRLAKGRVCPQGLGNVVAMINRCIREGRVLRVSCAIGNVFFYSVS